MSEGTDRSGKDPKPKPGMNAMEESDWLIVPEKAANEVGTETKEPLEGRGQTKENT